MQLIGLTGGIGSGKSSVSRRLAERGALIIDADLIVRELQEPGAPVFVAMVEAFGDGIVGDDGTLHRQAVADIVFRDKEALKQLNKIVGPAVRKEMIRRAAEQRGQERLVVMDIPLLAESIDQYPGFTAIVVVDIPPEVAVERLVAYRGFGEEDAWNRINNQFDRDERLAIATHVVDNSGTEGQLDARIEELWHELADLPHDTVVFED